MLHHPPQPEPPPRTPPLRGARQPNSGRKPVRAPPCRCLAALVVAAVAAIAGQWHPATAGGRAQSLPCWQSPPSPPLLGAPDASPLACRPRPARRACALPPLRAGRRPVAFGLARTALVNSSHQPGASPPPLRLAHLSSRLLVWRRQRRRTGGGGGTSPTPTTGSRPLLDPAAYGSLGLAHPGRTLWLSRRRNGTTVSVLSGSDHAGRIGCQLLVR